MTLRTTRMRVELALLHHGRLLRALHSRQLDNYINQQLGWKLAPWPFQLGLCDEPREDGDEQLAGRVISDRVLLDASDDIRNVAVGSEERLVFGNLGEEGVK